jgi:1-acyl-sn-glycerol-3-phosphate acyltransferase
MFHPVKRHPVLVILGLAGMMLSFAFWAMVLILRRIFFLPRSLEDYSIKTCSRWIAKSMAIKVRVENAHLYNPNEPALVIANHSSLVDIPMVHAACSARLRMLGKRELFWIPFMGWAMLASHYIGVNRGKKSSGARAVDLIRKRLSQGYQIFLAPEGTRSAKGCLLPFKPGAFRIAAETCTPIYVLGLSRPWEFLPKGDLFPPFKAELEAKFLGKIEPKNDENQVKTPEQLLQEARNLFLKAGFKEC